MNSKRVGVILLGALAMTIVLFFIDINFYNEQDFTRENINEVMFWSFMRGLVISFAVNIGNRYHPIRKK